VPSLGVACGYYGAATAKAPVVCVTIVLDSVGVTYYIVIHAEADIQLAT
jgi:hypothetical protein